MRHLRFVGASSLTGQTQRNVPTIRTHVTRAIRLWLPLTPLVLLFGPVVMAVSPLAALTRAGRRIGPVRAAWALGGLLLALSGTRISVDTPTVQVRIHIL